jgi:hypothetical protein
VRPGGVFVVDAVVGEAAVQDPDQTGSRGLARLCMVDVAGGPVGVIVDTCSWGCGHLHADQLLAQMLDESADLAFGKLSSQPTWGDLTGVPGIVLFDGSSG